MTATFQTVSSTREEYLFTIADLKESAPAPPKKGQKRTKLETGHINLIKALEDRIEAVDAELAVSNDLFTCLHSEKCELGVKLQMWHAFHLDSFVYRFNPVLKSF